MKLKTTHFTMQQGFRRDGSVIRVQIPQYRTRWVWQVNHGHQWERARNWFKTKKEAIAFAVKSAKPVHEWEEIYITHYPANGAIWQNGKLIGHKQAEKS